MKFLEFLALYNYCQGLMVAVILIAFIYSLRHYDRHRAFRILPYYFGSWLLLEGVQIYWFVSPPGPRYANVSFSIACLFTIFEFYVFSLLILHYIAGAGRRLAIKLNTVIIVIAEIFLYFRILPRSPIIPMDVLEAVALVPLCAIYFYELFTNTNTKALKDRPSFWIVTGIICQNSYNATLVIIMKHMGRFSDGAFSLAIVFYCILFVLFMRAYRCSPQEYRVA